MKLRSVRFLQSLALLTAASGCADQADAPVAPPATDAGGACSVLAGRACAVPGQLACGGPGGAASYGCVCRADACPNGGGSFLQWICGGGGALPPPEFAAA